MNEASLAILLSTTLQLKVNIIKSITFEQFLNLISALSESKDPKKFKANPRKVLSKLIVGHFVPLLIDIEQRKGMHS